MKTQFNAVMSTRCFGAFTFLDEVDCMFFPIRETKKKKRFPHFAAPGASRSLTKVQFKVWHTAYV